MARQAEPSEANKESDIDTMKIKLTRPLVVFDLETTGTEPSRDRIVEIGILKHNTDGSTEAYESLVNPQQLIPKEASDVHGITDEDVAEAPTFKELGEEVLGFIQGCDVAGYNIIGFDIPLLVEEFRRSLGLDLNFSKATVIDAYNVFKKNEPHTLEKAVAFYCNREHTDAHGAMADAEATSDVLEQQIARYFGDCKDMDEVEKAALGNDYTRCGRLAWDKDGELEITFGKHRGTKVRMLPLQYLHWLRRSKIFGEDHKANNVIRGAIDGRILPLRDTVAKAINNSGKYAV